MSKFSIFKLMIKGTALRWLASRSLHSQAPQRVESILVLRYDRIGDMVVTTPLIRELRSLYPSATIDVLASKKNAPVLASNENVSNIRVYPELAVGKLLFLLRARGTYDLVIDLNHSLIWQAVFELRLLNPGFIIAPKKGPRYGIDPRSLSLYNGLSETSVDRPLAEVYLDLLSLLSEKKASRSVAYDVPLDRENQLYASRMLVGLEAPFYGLNLSGGRPSMSLRDRDFVRIVEALLQQTAKGTVLLFSDPSSTGRVGSIFREFFSDNPRVVRLATTCCVMDAVAAIEHLSILVTPDTSLVHFACAKKIPLVAIYADEPALFRQWQPVSDAPWRVCFSKHNKSLNGYAIEEIIECISQLLDLTGIRKL